MVEVGASASSLEVAISRGSGNHGQAHHSPPPGTHHTDSQ